MNNFYYFFYKCTTGYIKQKLIIIHIFTGKIRYIKNRKNIHFTYFTIKKRDLLNLVFFSMLHETYFTNIFCLLLALFTVFTTVYIPGGKSTVIFS